MASPTMRVAGLLGGLLARLRRSDRVGHRPDHSTRSDEQLLADTEVYDALVIGAGISGIVFLTYARAQGLRCLAVDKHNDVGGLWSWLPAWQDIQNRKDDFAINDVPLEGVKQPDVLRHVRRWVEQYDLADAITLGREVTSVSRVDGRWHVRTTDGTFRAHYLIVASGVQNDPWIPEIDRSRSDVTELHSCQVHRPEDLAGRVVTVVGGGASAWDLLDLALDNAAGDVQWVHRSVRWFLPTTKPKTASWPNLRELSVVQSIARSADTVSAFLRGLLRREYDHFGLTDIEPAEPFDIREHMLIPGRSVMIADLDRITRHRGEVRGIEGHEVVLTNGARFETDVLLWGTGYRMNLQYLGLPEYEDIARLDDLFGKLGSLIRSRDHPDLFFVGMTLIESTSSTPFFAAIEAKSIVAHILGRCEIPADPVPHQITHWDLLRHFASFDRANYPRLWWRIKYVLLAWWYAARQHTPVKV